MYRYRYRGEMRLREGGELCTLPDMHTSIKRLLAAALFVISAAVCAQDATFQVKMLTPDTALSAARGALESCRKAGFQVAVAVVDRSGITQVLLRDRHAGAHTVEVATNKAWTSASFRVSTAALGVETAPDKPMSGLRSVPRVLVVGGGLPVAAGGFHFGGIGVSGAPGGEADEACARAGIKAVADALEF